jgi:hypothetical protein
VQKAEAKGRVIVIAVKMVFNVFWLWKILCFGLFGWPLSRGLELSIPSQMLNLEWFNISLGVKLQARAFAKG